MSGMIAPVVLILLQIAMRPAVAADLPTAPLSQQAAAAIAPVHDAYARVAAAQAALPLAKTDRERLERLLDEDQAGRGALERVDLHVLSEPERRAATDAMWREILTHDLTDQEALKAMMPTRGWFKRSDYGAKAATAAFLIVQHAVNDPALMRDVLARMKPLVASGEASGQDYALLYDRISLTFDHKRQLYGSQVQCRDGAWVAYDLADPARVDARRKAMGFDEDEAAYLAHFDNKECR